MNSHIRAISVLAAALAITASTVPATWAAPVTLSLDGSWAMPDASRNVRVAARADLDGIDASPPSTIGMYRVAGVHFDFERLGKLTSPFALEADPARTWMFLYPGDPGQRAGEVRFAGEMSSARALPNGILATDFDLRIYFSELIDDTPGALFSLGSIQSASLWLGTQVGAYSEAFTWGQFNVAGELPAPGQASAAAPGLIALGYLALRRRRRSP